MKKQKAFTLAEILITLSILGVVAAMTIPSVIVHYQEKVTVTKVKKMYSTLSAAYDRYLVENNWVKPTYAFTSAGAQQMYQDLVAPYMQVSVNAGTTYAAKKKIMYTKQYKWLDGSLHGNYSNSNKYYAVQLKDGSLLFFTKGVFRYDVNGIKEPNTIGKDLFFYSVTDKGIIPGKSSTYQTPQTLAQNCIIVNNNGGDDDADVDVDEPYSGSACTAYIILHGNMNYLK